MNEVKMRKSISTVCTIFKIYRVIMIIAAILSVIVVFAMPAIFGVLEDVMYDPSVQAELLSEYGLMVSDMQYLSSMTGEYYTPIMISVFVPAAVGFVLTMLCLKKSIDILTEMKEGEIFAKEYGTGLRSVCKLMVIQVVATFVVGAVAAFIFIPAEIKELVDITANLNLVGLFIAAIVNALSYILDYGYETKKQLELANNNAMYSATRYNVYDASYEDEE